MKAYPSQAVWESETVCMRRPLIYPLIAMAVGILIGDWIAIPAFYILTVSGTIFFLLLLSIRKHSSAAAFSLLLILMCMVGLFNIQRQQSATLDHRHMVHLANQGPLTLEGVVLNIEPLPPSNNVLLIRCQRTIKNNLYFPATGRIRLVIPSDLRFQYGDFIRFHSRIKKIQSFKNPGGFDHERYLHRKGIYVSGFVSNPADVVLIRHGAASGFRRKLENYRSSLKELIYKNASSPEREVIEAITLGNQNAIPQTVRDNFASTGTSHILSISGLHVGMVAAGGFFLILFLLKTSEYLMLKFNVIKLATAASFLPVIIYSLVAGMGTPVLRSALMALAFFTALLIGRQKDLLHILFLAALIILIALPESLFEISFQLSFCAVWAIIYMVPKFNDTSIPYLSSIPHQVQPIIRRIYTMILVSIAATLGTLPIIIFHFNRVSAVTLIANLIEVPLLGILVLIPALLAILTAVFAPGLAGLLIKTAAFFTHISLDIINKLASLPWSSFNVVKPNIPEIIVFYMMLFFLTELLSPENKKKPDGFTTRHPFLIKTGALISAVFLLSSAAYWTIKNQNASDLNMAAIDVGQGASTLIQMPRGINMLIDGGGLRDSSFDMGRFVIAPFLYAKRITKIDIVVLTHPHPDHLQGLIHIMNNFDVREVWRTRLKTDDDLYRQFEKAIHDNNIEVKQLSSQFPPERISDVTFQCLWPPDPAFHARTSMSYDDINNASLVLKMKFGTNSFLITGDISSQVEAQLIRLGQNLKSDLLFVPHHGSVHSSSEEFIRKVSSRFAIISSGRNNIFRHPHPAVIDRYTSAGTQVFRTDQDGAILIRSDGKTIHITPWRQRFPDKGPLP